MQKILNANRDNKKARVAILTPDKIDVKIEIVRGDKGHYMMEATQCATEKKPMDYWGSQRGIKRGYPETNENEKQWHKIYATQQNKF